MLDVADGTNIGAGADLLDSLFPETGGGAGAGDGAVAGAVARSIASRISRLRLPALSSLSPRSTPLPMVV